jgi:uncharacterized membrane protein YgdD (TMEM256/DUF423 family)
MLNRSRPDARDRWAGALVLFAGLAGACGVTEAAAAAHGSASPDLPIASNFLLIHAAVIGAAGLSAARSRLLLASATVLALALVLFSGDLSARAFGGARLFPMAAPIGGSLLILGWLGLAVAGAAFLIKGEGARERSSTR